MTDFEIGALIVAVSLAIGITVGVLIVIALPQLRYYRRARRYLDDRRREELPPYDDGEQPPRWPSG
jgi:hypothetical protein